MDTCHTEVRIILDHMGHPLAAVLIRHRDTDHEAVSPRQPGPFDTPEEVLRRILAEVDLQLSLW